jgi:tripartite-type tricarboxylate transporter receptor subunit TctC
MRITGAFQEEDELHRRTALMALAALAAPAPLRGFAQVKYPSSPLHIIVPFTPGGSTDILARALGQALTQAWKHPVVIDNKPGAGGAIGAEAAAKAAPDGHTLFMGHIGTLAVNPTLYPKLRYDPLKDFAPVALVAKVPNVLVVNPRLPANSVAELIALARSKPGELTYSTGGVGSAANLAMEYFKLETGTQITHVPYKGAAPAITDIVSGQVAMTMTGLPPLLGHIRSGRLRALGAASASRLAQLPDMPTIAEAGVPGFETTQWYGIVVPARTPQAVVAALAEQIQRSLATPELKKHLETEGALPESLGPEAFGKLIASEIARWAKVIRAAKIEI